MSGIVSMQQNLLNVLNGLRRRIFKTMSIPESSFHREMNNLIRIILNEKLSLWGYIFHYLVQVTTHYYAYKKTTKTPAVCYIKCECVWLKTMILQHNRLVVIVSNGIDKTWKTHIPRAVSEIPILSIGGTRLTGARGKWPPCSATLKLLLSIAPYGSSNEL